jgi:two-component system, NtrC family, C4-dicarboxylate transport sensor histidine kinase DctB
MRLWRQSPKHDRHANVRTLAWGLFAAALLLMTLWQTSHWARRYALQELRVRAVHTLNLVAENLRGELARFKIQPQLLATNPKYPAVLRGRSNEGEMRDLSRELERINAASGALDTYLMDASGLTVAASNWASAKPFVGLNFSYRPYFQLAMQGRLGRFLALGTTSNERGYYFAYPVRDGESIVGAVVVKMPVSHFETQWRVPHQEVIVIDENNVVFLSSNFQWVYRAIFPLTDAQVNQIASNQKYSTRQVQKMPILERAVEAGVGETMIIGPVGSEVGSRSAREPVQYLVATTELPEPEWRVLLLARTDAVASQVRATIALAGGSIVGFGVLAAFLLQRRKRAKEQIVIQQRVQDQLEERVQARTRELEDTNERLVSEIGEREKAEQVLRRTQASLIQAAKLAALGQMSAGISHELNQPLAAVRSYADNARAFLERDQADMAKCNLAEIGELTERMAKIIRHLRTYARDEIVEARPTPVVAALRGAVGLLEPRITSEGVAIIEAVPAREVMAKAGDVRLQQVFVNILANALDALRDAQTKQVHVAVEESDSRVKICIRDTGPGIRKEHLTNIFDPFFSTKQVGSGLGLGLSISDSIIRQFGGTIDATNPADGGAQFTISLLRAIGQKTHTL